MAPRDTENNAYAKFWGDKQRALWYVMVFLEWSIVRQIIDAFVSYNMELNNKNTRFIKINMRFVYFINPLSPNSDQHQFSPNNIST